MSDRVAILVSGSRDWRDVDVIKKRLALYPMRTILLHGDCGRLGERPEALMRKPVIGADWIAAEVGRHLMFNVWPLPYFGDLGKRGGPERNKCLLKILLQLSEAGFACSIEAFPIGESRGTRGCIAEARRYAEHVKPWPIHVTEGVANG